jgi:hypothetical protein
MSARSTRTPFALYAPCSSCVRLTTCALRLRELLVIQSRAIEADQLQPRWQAASNGGRPRVSKHHRVASGGGRCCARRPGHRAGRVGRCPNPSVGVGPNRRRRAVLLHRSFTPGDVRPQRRHRSNSRRGHSDACRHTIVDTGDRSGVPGPGGDPARSHALGGATRPGRSSSRRRDSRSNEPAGPVWTGASEHHDVVRPLLLGRPGHRRGTS